MPKLLLTNNNTSATLFFTDLYLLPIPEVDLAFAINAASVKAADNFEKAKAVIKSIIDAYAMNKLRYGVIVFGSSASIEVSFGDDFPTDESLKNVITILSGSKERPDLDKALKKGKELFDEAPERPNAWKVLVLITDMKSTSKLDDLKASAKMLEDDGIKVIPVAIGDEVDHLELEETTFDKENVVNATTDVDVIVLKEKIMSKVFKGKCRELTINKTDGGPSKRGLLGNKNQFHYRPLQKRERTGKEYGCSPFV